MTMNIHQAFAQRLSVVEALPNRAISPRRKPGETDADLIQRIIAADAEAPLLTPIRDIESAIDADGRAPRTPSLNEVELCDIAALIVRYHTR